MRRRNAVVVFSPKRLDERDFHAIARRVAERAPDVKVHLAIEGRRNRTARWIQLLRPTLRVELEPIADFPHLRGYRLPPVLAEGGDKLPALRRLAAAGLPVPDFVEITPGLKLDPATWGPYVVVKPSAGRRGANVILQRSGRVRYRAPEDYPEGHWGRRGPMLAQRFVYTGPWPSAYRVLSFLGVPLHAIRYEMAHSQAPIEDPAAMPDGLNIVAANKRSSVTLANEPDLLALTRQVHAALPELSFLGLDLVRDAGDGRLYVVEVNQRLCWTLSNGAGKKIQAQFGLDFYAQYGALDLAADALVAATRRLAR